MASEISELVVKLTLDTSDFDKALDLSLEKIQYVQRELAELQEQAGGGAQISADRFADRVGQAIAELTRRGHLELPVEHDIDTFDNR